MQEAVFFAGRPTLVLWDSTFYFLRNSPPAKLPPSGWAIRERRSTSSARASSLSCGARMTTARWTGTACAKATRRDRGLFLNYTATALSSGCRPKRKRRQHLGMDWSRMAN